MSAHKYTESELYGMGWEAVSAARGGALMEFDGETIDRSRFTNDTTTPEGRALELAVMLDRLAPEIVSLESAEQVWLDAASEDPQPWLATVADWALRVMPEDRADKVIKWAAQVTNSAYNREIQERAVITDTVEKAATQAASKGEDLSGKSLGWLALVALVGVAAYGYSKGGK